MAKSIWTAEERRAWQLPKQITVSEWADSNRILDNKTSAEPGPWRTDRTPYLREIMDSFRDPAVEDITLMTSTQVGKTEGMFNMLGYAMDQDPGPALFVCARQEDIGTIALDRVKPMIDLSPVLRSHKTNYTDDLSKKGMRLDEMILYFAGSNSPAGLSGKPIRYLFMDEVDKYPPFAGKEADPLKLARERARTFPGSRKVVKASTPTVEDGLIYREFVKSDQRKYFVPCPHCGAYQIFVHSQIKIPENMRDAEKIKSERLAWYECSQCAGRIEDRHKHGMLLKGHWVPEGCVMNKAGEMLGEIPVTTRRGYWLNAIYSPWLTFSEIIAEFLVCKDNPSELMNFVNSWLAEIWQATVAETQESRVRALAQTYGEGEVPDQAMVLTAAVDVQQDYFVVLIRGWGYHESSWLIRACQVESWLGVEEVLLKTSYKNKQGVLFQVALACIDTGFRTTEVYSFCREHNDVCRPVKGVDHLSGAPYTISRIDRFPKTGAVIPGGLTLYKIDTNLYKDKIARWMDCRPEDLTQWHVFKEPHDQYVKQVCAEHKALERDRTSKRMITVWKKKSRALANHYWDCEVYASAAADMLYVSTMRPEDDSQPVVYESPRREGNGFIKRSESGWISGGRGFLR